MKVSINILANHTTASTTCRAMADGIKAAGDTPVIRSATDYNMDGFNAIVIYGFVQECQDAIKAAEHAHIPWVFIDLGYWARSDHYKISVNDRHPTKYYMRANKSLDRFNRWGIPILPRKEATDGYILLAGMSAKAAWSFGLRAEQYERDTISAIQRITKRTIVYRPKPSWGNAGPIPGTVFDKKTRYDAALAAAHVVVTHHSNVATDAILAGIPAIAKRGAASTLAPYDLTTVENPVWPTDDQRRQHAANLAYCNWSVTEMRDGSCWRHLRNSGLVL
jgi:hypothetical protein